MTIIAVIVGGLACVGLGVWAGYKYCAHVHGKIFQALLTQGVMVLKTNDGWQGQPAAFLSIATQQQEVQDDSTPVRLVA